MADSFVYEQAGKSTISDQNNPFLNKRIVYVNDQMNDIQEIEDGKKRKKRRVLEIISLGIKQAAEPIGELHTVLNQLQKTFETDWDNIFGAYQLSLNARDLAYSQLTAVIKTKVCFI